MFRPDPRLPLMLLALLAPAPDARAEVTDPSKLESLKQEVDTSLERKKELEAKASKVAEDVAATRAKLIATAAKVQKSEAEVSASEVRLNELKASEAELLIRLEARRARLSSLLGALARLDANPPPALAVEPDDALGAVRGAILLGEAVPELKAEAAALKARLIQLQSLRAAILAERTTLSQATASLERDKTALESLLNTKLATQKKLTAAATSAETRAKALAQEATDLNDLIAKLENKASSRLPQQRPDPQAPKPKPPVEIAEKPAERPTELAMLSPPSEPSVMPSSRLFSQAKGLIRLPATGLLLSGFGSSNGEGGRTEGMTIATRPDAQVIAPFDGKVAYAGPFRRYGQLLILSVGEGYHVLLAGMSEIDASVGQTVLAGEPLGRMGGTSSSSSDEIAESRQNIATDGRPSLYIEFRKDSDPIDPRPWLKMSDTKARG
ncbi:MAG: peptidoglycan DD-metalloendopeptidase family protein [Parvibaculum sp.]|nr:peptidoglycan DD-metalloendopeptidase family protein [Parvibaculum sp.]